MSITIDQAEADLRAVQREAEPALRDALSDAASRAADTIRADWPVDTGASATAWSGDGPAVVNSEDYASEVHGGLADSLVPAAIDAEQATIEQDLDRRLRAAGGWDNG